MKPHFVYAALLACLPCPSLDAQQAPQAASLFDGKTLEGWDFDPKVWRVEDGVITGGSRTAKVPRNYFIATKKSFQNFELKLTVKCSGDPKTGLINSGIQIRSRRVPGGAHVAGYQVDCGDGWFGKIYDEFRRRTVIAEPVDAAALAKVVDVYGWNQYRIRAEGPRMRVWINDVLATDYTEKNPNIALDGVIAPQVHSGGVALVQIKDASIVELPPTPGAPTWKSLGGLEAALKKAPPIPKKRNPKAKAKGKGTNKIPSPPKGDNRVSFNFESGDLQGWYIADGWFGHLIADNKTIRAGGAPSNKEGKYFLSTLEAAPGGVTGDPQVGIVESPVFQLTGPKIQFAVSGGVHADTYVGLFTLDGKEVRKASGKNSEVFSPVTWNVPELVGKPVFVRLVDKNKGGWGHVTMDAFSAEGKLLPDETRKRIALAKPKKPSAKELAAAKAKQKRPGKKTQSARTTAKSAAEQLAGFTVPDGFVIELVASEEHGVINPIDLAFDDAGRLWTQTAQMYPLDPISGMKWQQFLDLMKDEKTQNTHPEFKRIKDLYQLKTKGEDKILILDDPTKAADGPLHVWADGLSIPQSILPYKDGAYVCHGSELFLLRDTDGDGKSDKMEPVLSGFGFTDTHTMSHLLVRGPGSYIHFSQGALNQGLVTAVASGFQDRIDAACQVRFGLDHEDFEVLSAGPSNMWGLQLRANGQWYGTEANDRAYCVIPWEHGAAVTGAAFRPMRPYQPLLPELHDFRVGGTGISGLEFSEDTEGGFPYEEWKDVALLANPITSTINAVRVHRNPDGTVEAEHLSDFLSSDDDWFRPVNLEFGPDGCLYIADFYNKIVSHNEVTTDHPDRDKAHGRIWRIRHESQEPREIPDVTKASPEQLLGHLQAPSLWEKRAAWQQIADRELSDLAPALVQLAGDEEKTITTRIHALWSLEELGHFDAKLVDALLDEENGDLRREAVRSIASFELKPASAAALATPFVEDENAMVRSQAIRTLGDLRSSDPAVFAGLIAACKPSLGNNELGGGYERNLERFLARMALERFPAELKSYLDKSSGNHPAGNLLWAIQALDDEAKQEAFLGIWSKVKSEAMDGETFIAISGMLNNPEVFRAVQPVFQDPSKAENLVGLAIANQSRVQSKKLNEMLVPMVRQLLTTPKTVGLGLKAVGKFRITALGAEVAKIPPMTEDLETLRLLLGAQAVLPKLNADSFIRVAGNSSLPFDIRMEAAHALAPVNPKEAARLSKELLTAADSYQKGQLVSLFSQSKAGGALLCSLAASGAVPPEAFDLSAAERVAQSHPANPEAKKIIAAARKRVAEQRKQAQERIHSLMSYISKNPGDPEKGKITFGSCLTCHKVGNEGQDIAPPLDGSGHRDLEHLLTAIVDPDAAVEGGYGLYRVTKTDGSVMEGYLDKKEALGTTVAMMGGARMFIPQTEIKSQNFVGGRSFMPPAFGQLPEETMADLVAYIGTLKEGEAPQKKTAKVAAPNKVDPTPKQGQGTDSTLLRQGYGGSGHAALPVVANPKPKTGKQPNIILIFTDDQGYEDLGCFGSKAIKTPHIDQMAEAGLKLTNFYAQPVCGVSRASLMTGSYPIRVAEPGNIKQLHTVPHPQEITMAEVLRSAGYATGLIGKWHLAEKGQGPGGFTPRTMPNAQGFDYFYGTPRFNGFTVYVEDTKLRSPIMLNEEIVVEAVQSWDNITKDYTEKAIDYIEDHQDKPFFLYLAHNMPHIPVGASENFKGKSEYGPYGDTIEEIDWSTGQILDKLRELKIDDDTLVIYTSDNGPWVETTRGMKPGGKEFIPRDHSGSAAPLRGWKMSAWDGGSKVPFVAHWPGKIAEGEESDELLSTMDLLPTFASLAGVDLPDGLEIDGHDGSDFLLGKSEASPRDDYYYYSGCLLTGVRVGEWKLVLPRPANPPGTGWWGRLIEEIPKAQLFHLENDPGETKDVASEHPDVVAKLMEKVKQVRAEVGDMNVVGSGARSFDPQPRSVPGIKKKLNFPTADPSAGAPATGAPAAHSVAATSSVAIPAPKAKKNSEKKPNFIVIFTDDQGYQDLGSYGSPDIATPNLDRMAEEGMRFTSFYAQTICGPSRTALMTSSYPLRVAQDKNRNETHPVVHSDEITIAEVLNTVGYRSAAFGKWDLATHSQTNWIDALLPRGQGFDYFFGTPSSNDRVVHLLRNEEVIERNADMATLTQRYTDEAIQYIEKNKDEPFFVYLAHSLPHTKLAASKEFRGKSKGGFYGDVIEEIDHHSGRILDKVKELGLDDNTYVIFTSDNGPWLLRKEHGGHALPLRSGKTTCWEGGVRVPCIVRAPGRVPAGTTNDLVTATIDLLPTFASLAGAKVPTDRVLDGIDISQVWHGEQKELDRTFFYYQHHYLRGVRKGDWKVMLKHREGPKSATAKWSAHVAPRDSKPLTAHQLYNLKEDIGETTDLAAKHPDKLAEMLELADSARADIGDFDRIGKNARFFDEGPNRLGEVVPAQKTATSPAKSAQAAAPAKVAPTKKPNFVIIFTDDQGYGDLSCFGGKHVSTPRIDQMAAEGSRLTSFYVAAPVCTPSRAALMTGSYPKRIDMATGSDFGVLLAGDRKGLNPDEITIAEVLKGAGYKTGMFGKWHLGDQPEFLPTRQGFDEFFGIPYSHDIHPFHPAEKWNFPPLALLDQEKVIETDPDADFLTKRFTDRAVDFIKENSDKPFFVYLPHPIPHKPLHVSPPFMEEVDPAIIEALDKEGERIDYKTRDKLFRQAISEIDWSVGRILDTLKEEGVDDNTLVIFFSDNGPAIGKAGPLKGRKGSTFEGGMREPTVIRWPGQIPAGQDNSELMTAMDLLPTFAKLAGAEVPADQVIDGKDVWAVLAGEAKTPHKHFFYHGGNNLKAVRSGDWKLHVNGKKPVALYNLATDIGEKKNALAKNPDVAKLLLGEIAKFQKDLSVNSRPAAFVKNPKPLSKE